MSRFLPLFPPETGGEWVKISFATEKKELIENLRVTGPDCSHDG